RTPWTRSEIHGHVTTRERCLSSLLRDGSAAGARDRSGARRGARGKEFAAGASPLYRCGPCAEQRGVQARDGPVERVPGKVSQGSARGQGAALPGRVRAATAELRQGGGCLRGGDQESSQVRAARRRVSQPGLGAVLARRQGSEAL